MRVVIAMVVAGVVPLACTTSQPGSCLRENDNLCVESTRAQAVAAKRMCGGLWGIGSNDDV